MKKSIVNLLIVAAVITSVIFRATGSSKNTSLSGNGAVILSNLLQKKDTVTINELYTCQMHPEVIQDTPGKCPKCKMNLVKKEIAKAVYTCPMHPEVIQNKPGKCPKCKMNLSKKETAKK